MRIIDKILGVFGIRRRESSKVLDKIWDSLDFGWEGEIDWEVRYTRNDQEDRNVYVCQWETVKIVSAGRIYIDEDGACARKGQLPPFRIP